MRRIGFYVLCVLCVCFVSGKAIAQSDQELVNRYDLMYAAQDYESALEAATTICDRYSNASGWHFKTGALLARLKHPDQAIKYLQICADLKFTGIGSFENNSDLDSIRDRDDFKAIIETVRSNAQARMDEFQAEARKHKPKTFIPREATDGSKPAIVIALHGTGMDGGSMFDVIKQACINEGAILIAPDALRPAGDGFAWTYRDESKWFVNYLIEQAVAEHNGDPDQVILIGFSQGANIALILGQTQPETFAAVVPICGHYEAQNAESTGTPAPFYLIIGARDPWKNTYVHAKKDFANLGGKVHSRLLAGKGHELPMGKAGIKIYEQAIRWGLAQD